MLNTIDTVIAFAVIMTVLSLLITILVQMVSTSRIVFGTDFPFRTAADHEQGLINFGFNESELRAINRENALQFLPRFKA